MASFLAQDDPLALYSSSGTSCTRCGADRRSGRDEAPERTAQLLVGSLGYAHDKDGLRTAGTNKAALTLPGNAC